MRGGEGKQNREGIEWGELGKTRVEENRKIERKWKMGGSYNMMGAAEIMDFGYGFLGDFAPCCL